MKKVGARERCAGQRYRWGGGARAGGKAQKSRGENRRWGIGNVGGSKGREGTVEECPALRLSGGRKKAPCREVSQGPVVAPSVKRKKEGKSSSVGRSTMR